MAADTKFATTNFVLSQSELLACVISLFGQSAYHVSDRIEELLVVSSTYVLEDAQFSAFERVDRLCHVFTSVQNRLFNFSSNPFID